MIHRIRNDAVAGPDELVVSGDVDGDFATPFNVPAKLAATRANLGSVEKLSLCDRLR